MKKTTFNLRLSVLVLGIVCGILLSDSMVVEEITRGDGRTERKEVATLIAKTDTANAFTKANTFAGRLQLGKGADVASAEEITLGTDGNYFDIITGTTPIDHINKTDWQTGSVVILQFDASVTVTHDAGAPAGTEASILLSGAADFSATANDTLQLVYDGTTFREVSRTVI